MRGGFSSTAGQSASPNLLFSRKTTDDAHLPDATLWNWVRVRFTAQDRFINLLKAQGAKPNLTEERNAYVHETLYHGRTEYELEVAFKEQTLKPLARQMNLNGLSIEDMDQYLYARHSPEANACMQAINPDRDNNQALSGISNLEAARVMNDFAKIGKLKKIERVVKKVDVIVEAGLETEHTATVQETASTLTGVGPVKAEAIVVLREALGEFMDI